MYYRIILLELWNFLTDNFIIAALGIIYVLAFALTGKIYIAVFKDIINFLVLFSLFLLLKLIVRNKGQLENALSCLNLLLIYLPTSIVLIQIVSFFNTEAYNIFYLLDRNNTLSDSDYTAVDYNFALLPIFFGLISILALIPRLKDETKINFFNVIILLFSIYITFSGSRRGMIILIVILGIVVFYPWLPLRKNEDWSKLRQRCKLFFLLFPVMIILTGIFIYYGSYNLKSKTLQMLGVKKHEMMQVRISRQFFRYFSLFDRNLTIGELNERIWTRGFDPSNPDSGWGKRNHRTVYPLTGANVGIVPENVHGYLMDSTCNSNYYAAEDICESWTLVFNHMAYKNQRLGASVFCFVSSDCNIDDASISVAFDHIDKNVKSGKATAEYNFEEKGKWQKLELDFICNNGEIPIYLSFIRNGVRDFKDMKGYIIFAYPLLKENFQFESDNGIHPGKQHISLLNQDGLRSSQHEYSPVKFFSFLANPLFIMDFSQQTKNDNDPFRKFINSLIVEDTTYSPTKSKITLRNTSIQFIDDRFSRWDFSIKIFNLEYSFPQKLFGGGFNFLNWYGYYFLNDKTAIDYPHNPFLSILLYSGIFGLIIYCIFMYKVFHYYIKYIKEYPLLFVFFLITFFFSFFSGGSPFDPPIMGFFSILPFFIHSVHKRSLKDTNE